jgi:hypothetical protein
MVYICQKIEKLSTKMCFFAKFNKNLVTEIYEPALMVIGHWSYLDAGVYIVFSIHVKL